MMIKLFLVTLLCATLVFANSPVRNFQDVREKLVNGFLSMTNHFKGRDGGIVRRSAQESLSGLQPLQQEGGKAGGGFSMGAGAGGKGGWGR